MEKKSWTPLNPRRGAAKQPLTGWRFMVFIAGDNNLDPAALKDIAEMAKVGSAEDLTTGSVIPKILNHGSRFDRTWPFG